MVRRESGSRFHSLGAEKWNARELITVLYRGSANYRRVPDDRRQRQLNVPAAYRFGFGQAPVNKMVPATSLSFSL